MSWVVNALCRAKARQDYSWGPGRMEIKERGDRIEIYYDGELRMRLHVAEVPDAPAGQ